MLGRFPNTELYKYPRMSSEDVKIWQRFLIEFGSDYDRFDYDLKVGTGIIPQQPVPQKFIDDYIELSKKRIDAVGYNSNGATIFEVKPRAGSSALGQLLIYSTLFKQTYSNTPVYELCVVCSLITPEEVSLYQNHDIKIFEFRD